MMERRTVGFIFYDNDFMDQVKEIGFVEKILFNFGFVFVLCGYILLLLTALYRTYLGISFILMCMCIGDK